MTFFANSKLLKTTKPSKYDNINLINDKWVKKTSNDRRKLIKKYSSEQEKVKILRLSKILENYKYKKIFVKIDTQGYEFEILKSISKNNFNNIFAFEIETNLVSTYKNLTLIEDVIKFLRNKGYTPLRIENGLGMPNFGQQLQVDILFVKNQ